MTLMKRFLLIIALCIPLLESCVIDNGDSSNYDNFHELVRITAESRLEYPIVMAETAMSVMAYDAMAPEDKVEMGYIYENVIKISDSKFQMDKFHSFILDTGGKSLENADALWTITVWGGSFDYRERECVFKLCRQDDSDGHMYRLVCEYEGYEPYEIYFSPVEDEEAYYSWEMDMSCRFTTTQGREVDLTTVGPFVRKVYRAAVPNERSSCVIMEGTVNMRVDGDALDYEYAGLISENTRYNF